MLEQFRELARHRSFDDPSERRSAEIVVLFYEMTPTPPPRDAAQIASIAEALGVTPGEARRRIEEVEALIGLSADVPIHRAMISYAATSTSCTRTSCRQPGTRGGLKAETRRLTSNGERQG